MESGGVGVEVGSGGWSWEVEVEVWGRGVEGGVGRLRSRFGVGGLKVELGGLESGRSEMGGWSQGGWSRGVGVGGLKLV